ncbi:MAG: hypothetical protein AMXMBFR55_13130 [Gemmatimonadota bacterium]
MSSARAVVKATKATTATKAMKAMKSMKSMNAMTAAAMAAMTMLTAAADAQVFQVGRERAAGAAGPRRSPVYAGASFTYAVPQGDFRDNVKQGFGVDGNVHYKLDRQGIFSLGGELGFLGYGRETKRVSLSSTIGRVNVDMTTSNNIFWMGVGPQLTVPSGPIRPYVNATAGFSVFWTESSVEGSWDNEPFAKSTNYDDATFAWTGGGGFLIPIGASRQGALDIGVRYHGNGNVRYLRRGDIIDLPGGEIQLRVNEGETPLLSWRVGFRWGLF